MFLAKPVEPYATIFPYVGLVAALGLIAAAIAGVLTGIPWPSTMLFGVIGVGLTVLMLTSIYQNRARKITASD